MDEVTRAGTGRALGGPHPALSVREAALRAGVNERTVRRAITDGRLLAAQVGGAYRIAPEHLAAWIAARRAPAGMSARASEVRAGGQGTPGELPPDARELIARLESEVTYLRETLSAEVEARRRADHLVAGLLERLPDTRELPPGEILDAEEPRPAYATPGDAPQSTLEGPGRLEGPHIAPSASQGVPGDPGLRFDGLVEGWRQWWRRITGHEGGR